MHHTLHRILNSLSLSQAWLPSSPGGLHAVRDLTSHLGRRQGSALDTSSFMSPCRPLGAEPSGQPDIKHHSAPSSLAHGFLVATESELRSRAQLTSVAVWLQRLCKGQEAKTWHWFLQFLLFSLKVRPVAAGWRMGRTQELREGLSLRTAKAPE